MRNQSEETLDELAASIRAAYDSSLNGETSQEETLDGQEENLGDDTQGEETSQEETNQGFTQTTTEAQEDLIPASKYKELEEKIRELESRKETAAKVDFSWFNSEEGKLYLTDLDTINLEESAYDFNVKALMEAKGFSEKDAIEELEFRYPNMFSEDADQESREYKAEYRDFLSKARERVATLKERKSTLEVPVSQSIPEEQIAQDFDNRYIDRSRSEYTKRAAIRRQMAEKLLDGKDSISLNIEGHDFDYKIRPDVAAKIKQDLTDLESIGGQYVGVDGKVNENGLLQLLLLKNDPKTFFDIVAGKNKAAGKKEVVTNEIKNTNFNKTTNPQMRSNPYPKGHKLHEVWEGISTKG